MAVVAQREAELNLAKARSGRSSMLAAEGAASQQQADDDRMRGKLVDLRYWSQEN